MAPLPSSSPSSVPYTQQPISNTGGIAPAKPFSPTNLTSANVFNPIDTSHGPLAQPFRLPNVSAEAFPSPNPHPDQMTMSERKKNVEAVMNRLKSYQKEVAEFDVGRESLIAAMNGRLQAILHATKELRSMHSTLSNTLNGDVQFRLATAMVAIREQSMLNDINRHLQNIAVNDCSNLRLSTQDDTPTPAPQQPRSVFAAQRNVEDSPFPSSPDTLEEDQEGNTNWESDYNAMVEQGRKDKQARMDKQAKST